MSDLLDLFNVYRVPAQHLVSFLLAGAIWRWGGGPERWLIGVFMATMVLPIYVMWWFRPAVDQVHFYDAAYVVLDVVAAVLFVGIALNANRNYPLWIAGFQLVAVAAHSIRVVADSVSTLAFARLIIGPSYCQLLILLGGFMRHVLRQQRFGPYREWRLAPPGAGWFRP
jgi:hypothetical protein